MEKQSGSRSAIAGSADPFSDYALTDFANEVAILETLGAAWKMQFCQATMGFSRRPGGLWIAYTADRKAKSVLHVERFVGKSTDHDRVNFWASDILQGKLYSGAFNLPFTVIAAFEDGRFALKFERETVVQQSDSIGERVRKGAAYAGVINMVSYFSLSAFKRIDKQRESAEK
jgi:hypothetical protein